MFWTYPTPPAAGRPIDPILTAYLVAAGAPMLVAGLIWGLSYLLTSGDPAAAEGAPGGRPNRPTLCRRCGYDVRATPDGATLFERCPECGEWVVAEGASGAELGSEAGAS